jgi:hypothetical protein
MSTVLHTLAQHVSTELTDGQLLGRYVTSHDAATFEILVRRHGPMVLGVCRRLLPSLHDAEDAFQATFLVLVRKASTITPREAVGSWLYGVAYRAAQKVRVAAARRRSKEAQVAQLPEPSLLRRGSGTTCCRSWTTNSLCCHRSFASRSSCATWRARPAEKQHANWAGPRVPLLAAWQMHEKCWRNDSLVMVCRCPRVSWQRCYRKVELERPCH